jgi:hypothetical protein
MKKVLFAVMLVFVAAVLIATAGCQRITKESADVSAPKNQPPYTVEFDPNRSGASK